MLRLLFFFLFLLPAVHVFAQDHTAGYTATNQISPAMSVEERGGNLYLIGRGFHITTDTAGKPAMVCATPVYTGMVTFLFTDGNTYAYTPKEVLPNTSFVVLLRGEAELPETRRGIGRWFKRRERVYGDAALLHRLQNKDLQTVRYEQETTGYWNGKPIKTSLPARTYANPTAFAELRRQLKR